MSEQVAGQPEGVSLLDAINDGTVPYPARMSYVRWLEWRKETGSRPVKRRDGRSTTNMQEVALWKSVMEFLHDVHEEEEEEEGEEVDEEDESPPPLEPVEEIDGPELIPDAGNELGEAAALEQAAARAAAAAPTAGATGLAAAGDGALAVVPLSAVRRAGLSGPPSTAGSVPATAESLQADLREMYRPDQEPVAAYLTRLSHRLGASCAWRCDLVGGARRARGEGLAPGGGVWPGRWRLASDQDGAALAGQVHGRSA